MTKVRKYWCNTVSKLQEFTLKLFWQNSRENNGFAMNLLNGWFDGIFFFGESKYAYVHFSTL